MKYVRAGSLQQAADILKNEPGLCRILSGGTDVLIQNRLELVEPDQPVDLKHLPGMRTTRHDDEGTRIGAAVSGAKLGEGTLLRTIWPGVV